MSENRINWIDDHYDEQAIDNFGWMCEIGWIDIRAAAFWRGAVVMAPFKLDG